MYSKKITSELYNVLRKASAGMPSTQAGSNPSSLVRITPITNPSHPANGQHGLFASQNLAPDSFVICYIGYIHPQEEADPSSDYDLSLDRELDIGIDATHMGNEARFINDYRGIGPAPNAEFRDVWVNVGQGVLEKRIGVYVLGAGKSGKRARGIPKGTEILVSYGKGFWRERQKEHDDLQIRYPDDLLP